jgi:hypothetical protein
LEAGASAERAGRDSLLQGSGLTAAGLKKINNFSQIAASPAMN